MFGLEEKYIKFITDTIKKHLPDENCKIYIFGSRAKGNFKEYSDIDIAIDNNEEILSADILGELITEFVDSTMPYEVDIVDLNSIDENFKELIINDLKPFYD